MMATDGWKIISQRLDDEVTRMYKVITSGTKEDFEKNQGKLLGLSYIPNLLKEYFNKKK